MELYWVIVYPLHTKFPFHNAIEAFDFYKLADTYFPQKVDISIPFN